MKGLGTWKLATYRGASSRRQLYTSSAILKVTYRKTVKSRNNLQCDVLVTINTGNQISCCILYWVEEPDITIDDATNQWSYSSPGDNWWWPGLDCMLPRTSEINGGTTAGKAGKLDQQTKKYELSLSVHRRNIIYKWCSQEMVTLASCYWVHSLSSWVFLEFRFNFNLFLPIQQSRSSIHTLRWHSISSL